MIDYVYRAKNQETGELVTANVQAENPQAAAKLLASQGLFALDITPSSRSDLMSRLGINRRVSPKDRVLFTRQLSTLINAGLPLVRALHTVQDQIEHQNFREVISQIATAVEGGASLSAAFTKHPKVFNEIYVALVAAAETSGTLDKALIRLANQQEKDAAVVSKIRSALIYPAIVVVLIVAVIGLMLTTIVPQVSKLYHDLHKELPLLTQGLVNASSFLTAYWWVDILGLIAIVVAARRFLASDSIKLRLDALTLRLPVFGIILRKVHMARFTRTLSTMLASGIPMLQAIETAQRAVTNRLLKSELDVVIPDVRGGKALSESLEQHATHFMPLVHQMLKVGEESGTIDEMSERAAVYFESEVDEAVKNLSTTLEPVMMVVLGGIVALVLGAVLWPIYSLVGSGSLQ